MMKTILGLVLSLAIGTVAVAAPQGGADHPAVRLFLCACLAKEVEVVHRDATCGCAAAAPNAGLKPRAVAPALSFINCRLCMIIGHSLPGAFALPTKRNTRY